MAYDGKLIKIGPNTSGLIPIPLEFIQYSTLHISYDPVSIKDSDMFASGREHNSISSRRQLIVEFQTKEMYEDEMQEFFKLFRGEPNATIPVPARWVSEKDRTILCSAYVTEYGGYKTDVCKLETDVGNQIKYANEKTIRYNPITVRLTGIRTASATY